ncbi:polyprenol monophosphomannose synthase [Flavobacteriaceae bacterium]|nr:polyprenol monophosphomannose synthase [Flavobacteriaceae bacterium]
MKNTLIVIPTYNEADNIEAIICETLSINEDYHALVVDDSSPDGTGALVENLFEQFPDRLFLETRPQKEGLGRAYLHAFRWALAADYKFIFEMDADFSHNPQDVPKMELQLLGDADVVIGSRYVDGINVVNWPLSRILLSLAASYYVKFFTSLPVKDATAGFVGYKAEVLRAIDLDTVKFVGYAFQIELKYKAWKKGFKLKEYSIIFLNRAKGQSKMNGSIIWEAIYGVVFLRIQSLFKRKQ